jgi:2-methylcitrate dehydratase PrpD
MLNAATAAREQLGLESAAAIAEIDEVSVHASSATIADNFDSDPHKRRPTQIVEAQFALPYLIAAALIHGRVGITEVALRDGRSAAVTLSKPLGAPTNPVSVQQLKMKSADCARNAVRPLADEVLRYAAESFLRLQSISNVSTLLRQFA